MSRFDNFITNDNLRSSFRDVSGRDLRQSFVGLKSLPFVNDIDFKRQARTTEEKRYYAEQRAAQSRAKFSLEVQGTYPDLRGDVQQAQKEIAIFIGSAGLDVMYDKDGYMAYGVDDVHGNRAFSTNLSRLRRWFQGKRDQNTPTIPAVNINNDGYYQAQSRAWTVLISWHKLLNSVKDWRKNWMGRDTINVAVDLERRKQKNKITRIYGLARGDNLNKYIEKSDANNKKVQDRRQDYINNLTQLVLAARQQLPVQYGGGLGAPGPNANANVNLNNLIPPPQSSSSTRMVDDQGN